MTQRVVYYQIMTGLPGCLPNNHSFYSWHTRAAMVQAINAELDWYGFPLRARRQVNLVEVWRYIQGGGTKGHFVIRGQMGNPCNMEFVQIAKAEFEAWEGESE